jgi:hypothetical protein
MQIKNVTGVTPFFPFSFQYLFYYNDLLISKPRPIITIGKSSDSCDTFTQIIMFFISKFRNSFHSIVPHVTFPILNVFKLSEVS